jgi:hypothetical protein
MFTLFSILLSGFLYRVPRGGPDLHWWHKYFGYGLGSAGGSIVWAGITTLLLYLVITMPIWVPLVVFAALMLGESIGYMRWVSDEKVDVLPLTLRGLLLLNPFMGVIYYTAHKYRDSLPVFPAIFDGWTAWAELACGFCVAIGYIVVLSLLL